MGIKVIHLCTASELCRTMKDNDITALWKKNNNFKIWDIFSLPRALSKYLMQVLHMNVTSNTKLMANLKTEGTHPSPFYHKNTLLKMIL